MDKNAPRQQMIRGGNNVRLPVFAWVTPSLAYNLRSPPQRPNRLIAILLLLLRNLHYTRCCSEIMPISASKRVLQCASSTTRTRKDDSKGLATPFLTPPWAQHA